MIQITDIEKIRQKLNEYEPVPFEQIDPETLKELFINTIQKNFEPNLILTENFEKVLTLIIQYLQKDEDFEKQGYSLDKGFIIMGNVGTGKTLLLRAFKAIQGFFHRRVNFAPTYQIVSKFSMDGYLMFENTDSISHYLKTPICLDDLGAESTGVHFGQKVNVIAELIQRRYDIKQSNRPMFGSTNLNKQMLSEIYGSRIYSRLNEMCNFFVLDGKDFRINKIAK